MRPLRSFLILLIFLVCFTGLHYLVPVGQLFPSVNEFVPAYLTRDLFSVKKELNISPAISLPDSAESIPPKILSYASIPESIEDSLFMPLYGLLDSISHSSGQPRIMYYGDSQIEGDRITSFLRKSLREGNHGTGPGLFLPLMPVMYTESIWIRSSSNWKRYNFLSYRSGEISHKALGPFMAICRYLPEGERTVVPEKATVRIRPSKFADSTSSEFDLLRMFYGNTEGVVNFVVKADEEEVFSDTLKRGKGYNEIVCQLKGGREILIEFEGNVSPDIYGISIESKKGVIVDNMPQRGSAGLEFTMVDSANLAESYKKLSPDLFILHYGLNIVKNVRDDYTYYRKGLVKQISLLRKISPLTPVLLIGVTDMATNEGDSIMSYRNIPAIIEAQMRAARETGIFFWDSYHAMGGESSIVAWSDKKAPLSQKDYVHFTNQGADTLSKLLIEARFTPKSLDSGNLNTLSAKQKQIELSQPEIIKTKTQIVEEISFFRSLLSQIFKYDPDNPMIFSTSAFWFFFLIVLAGYSLIYKKLFLRNSYLFLLSLFFYYKSGGLFLLLLIFVTVIDFTCGLLIYNSRTRLMRRVFIVFSIFSNLGILAYFKYTAFIVSSINVMLGTDFKVYDFLAAFSNTHLGTSFNLSNILLPVGISFFTFQSLSYTLDIYRKKMDPVRNIIDFGFYVSFFPQLVAGPIVRASEFIPQLYSEFHLGKREFSHSLFLISKGLIKKIIISDFIAVNFIDRVFDAPSIYSGFENLMAVYGYGLQIYCDFSGYTDIAIGLALILGFRLPANFNSPYKADSISDFWKRWHISLSRWLKDYLYIPLGGNRRGKVRTNINLMITMILGGLWHGASLKFIIWGGIHGVGLVAGSIWRSIFGLKFNAGLIGRLIGIFITFHFVTFCWIFFRAPDLDSAGTMLKQIFENFSPGSYFTVLPAYSNVFLLIVVGYLIHFLPEKTKESYRGLFIRVPLPVQLGFIMLVAILLIQMRTTEVMPFIYFRF
jgi:alginate O-acetyltransferase complex protein AlgI